MKKPGLVRNEAAFTLIEMVAVIAILVTLMTAGLSLMKGAGPQSRRTATDMLTGQIERARTTAITSRTNVFLVVAEPGDLPSGDEKARIGLFRVDTWPPKTPSAPEGVLLSRWQALDTGVVLIEGQKDGIANPMDGDQIEMNYKGGNQDLKVTVHAIGFNSRGGLLFPAGSTPVALRVAEGAYRNSKATPNKSAAESGTNENMIKIGRVTARPYRVD